MRFSPSGSASRSQKPARLRLNGILFVALAVLSVAIAAASALAADEGTGGSQPPPSQLEAAAAIESEASETGLQQLTNPVTAEGMQLQSLQRDEALELLSGVFEVPVEEAAGVFDELQGAKLLDSHTAVLPTEPISGEEASPSSGGPQGGDETVEAMPEVEARPAEGPPPDTPAKLAHADMIDSTIPLQVEGGATIDLSLDRKEGHLEPVTPLVESQIPGELGEGITLPGPGIGIDISGVQSEREASVTGNSVAFYPNVSEDADLAISPTPTGVETMTQLRSTASPDRQSYRLSLPSGATLSPTQGGGAEVRADEEVLLKVPPPTAIDASGQSVPVELDTVGEELVVHVHPAEETQYPVLVDPLFQVYEWSAKGNDLGICSNSFQQESFYACNQREEWGYDEHVYPWAGGVHMNIYKLATHGINIHAEREQKAGDYATVLYTVPRYFKESPVPTSFIKNLWLSDVDWEALGQYASPYLFMGLWDMNNGWASYYSHTGQVEHGVHDHAYVYAFSNPQPYISTKEAAVSIIATEATAGSNASVHVGAATVELGDLEAPGGPVTSSQSQWVNQSAPPLTFTASDTGLGVYAVSASSMKADGSPERTWTAKYGCIGVGDSACPRTWKSSEAGHPALIYEPALLPTGYNYLAIVAEDPVGNRSPSSWAEVKVDHIPPQLNLSGSMTEQDALGARHASYTLKVNGSDGTAQTPQSGISIAEVRLDGKAVAMEGKQLEAWSPKCTTQNCALSAEWTFDCSSVAEGTHTVEVVAKDAVGNVGTKTLTIETRPAPAPSLTLSGSMIEQGSLTTERPRYLLKAQSTAMAAGSEAPPLGAAPAYTSSFGTSGEGSGQFMWPADAAVDGSGNIWVLDIWASRLQEFDEEGHLLRSAGGQGTGAGKLNFPSAVALDSGGNLWASDTSSNRIVEFNSKGEFIQTFGTNVNKTKVEAGGTAAEKNLCTAASGDVCQAATAGSGAGQLKSPKGIAITSSGSIWVVDSGNNRLQKFSPSGALLNNISGEGTEPGKLKSPTAIAVAPDGSIWVADTGNNRIEQWNSSLAFVRAVGKEGSAGGEFKSPAAIEADPSGDIWVGDKGNNRVEVFGEGGRYFGQFGASGSGRFSLSNPMGIAIAPDESIWVTDPGHYKVQKWTQETPTSEITTLAWVDGVQATGLRGVCKTQRCTIEPQWALTSAAYSPGSHTVRVKTTDGLGRSSDQSITVQIARDETKPVLEAGGELFNAPEGWVEQETYGLNATASDAGYGVTSIAFKIDGQEVASVSQSCADGGCNETLSKQISMAGYPGGSHPAEFIATDGAGNTSTKKWTINVDPEGHISTEEATSTLEAAEITSDQNLLGPSREEQDILGTTAGMRMDEQSGSLIATGSAVPTTIEADPADGMVLQIPPDGILESPCEGPSETPEEEAERGEVTEESEEPEEMTSPCESSEEVEGETFALKTIAVTPVNTALSSGQNTLINGSVTVAPNTTTSGVDTVVRPLYEGALTFQIIRNPEAPEVYSWKVALAEGQTLKLIDDQHAMVYYASGHPAFSIVAEPAADALGTTVPTNLSVEGQDTVSLAVHHTDGAYVYPVVAGAGWQGGFTTTTVQGPKDEQELREERERIEQEEREALEAEEEGGEVRAVLQTDKYIRVDLQLVGPPIAGISSEGVAQGYEQYTYAKKFLFRTCYYEAPDPFVPEPPSAAISTAIAQCKQAYGWRHLEAKLAVHGWYRTNTHYGFIWILKGNLHCDKWGPDEPAMVNCEKFPSSFIGGDEPIQLKGDYRFRPNTGPAFLQPPGGAGTSACVTMRGRILYGSGPHMQEPMVQPARQGDPCPWPSTSSLWSPGAG